jgi:hypothetical protein
MALAQTRYRENYPSAQEGVANTTRLSGNFTTAAGADPTVKSTGPWSVVHAAGTGQYTITLTEPVVEFLAIDCGLWAAAAQGSGARVLLTPSVGSSSTPASFVIETQSASGTAGNLTGPIVTFDVAYRKGALKK